MVDVRICSRHLHSFRVPSPLFLIGSLLSFRSFLRFSLSYRSFSLPYGSTPLHIISARHVSSQFRFSSLRRLTFLFRITSHLVRTLPFLFVALPLVHVRLLALPFRILSSLLDSFPYLMRSNSVSTFPFHFFILSLLFLASPCRFDLSHLVSLPFPSISTPAHFCSCLFPSVSDLLFSIPCSSVSLQMISGPFQSIALLLVTVPFEAVPLHFRSSLGLSFSAQMLSAPFRFSSICSFLFYSRRFPSTPLLFNSNPYLSLPFLICSTQINSLSTQVALALRYTHRFLIASARFLSIPFLIRSASVRSPQVFSLSTRITLFSSWLFRFEYHADFFDLLDFTGIGLPSSFISSQIYFPLPEFRH